MKHWSESLRALQALLISLALAGCATAPLPEEAAPAPAVAAQPAEPAASAVPVAAAASAPEAESGKDVAGVPTYPLRPELPVDLDDSSARIDLWQRIRGGFAMPD